MFENFERGDDVKLLPPAREGFGAGARIIYFQISTAPRACALTLIASAEASNPVTSAPNRAKGSHNRPPPQPISKTDNPFKLSCDQNAREPDRGYIQAAQG